MVAESVERWTEGITIETPGFDSRSRTQIFFFANVFSSVDDKLQARSDFRFSGRNTTVSEKEIKSLLRLTLNLK